MINTRKAIMWAIIKGAILGTAILLALILAGCGKHSAHRDDHINIQNFPRPDWLEPTGLYGTGATDFWGKIGQGFTFEMIIPKTGNPNPPVPSVTPMIEAWEKQIQGYAHGWRYNRGLPQLPKFPGKMPKRFR